MGFAHGARFFNQLLACFAATSGAEPLKNSKLAAHFGELVVCRSKLLLRIRIAGGRAVKLASAAFQCGNIAFGGNIRSAVFGRLTKCCDFFLGFGKTCFLIFAAQIRLFHGVALVGFQLFANGGEPLLGFLFLFRDLAVCAFQINDVAAGFFCGFQFFCHFVACGFQFCDFSAAAVFVQKKNTGTVQFCDRFFGIDALIAGEQDVFRLLAEFVTANLGVRRLADIDCAVKHRCGDTEKDLAG